MGHIVNLQKAEKTYHRGDQVVRALSGVDLQVEQGDFLAVTGVSGSGKSTLLHILGCLEQPSAGRYFLGGEDVGSLSDFELSAIRAGKIGFVFQSFHLLAGLTVRENVLLPFSYNMSMAVDETTRADELLDKLGVSHRKDHLPNELSGGEMQRVAIARALIGRPQLLLADEPTGNLDKKTSEEVLEVFTLLHQQENVSIILVTHDPDVSSLAQRQITISDGHIV